MKKLLAIVSKQSGQILTPKQADSASIFHIRFGRFVLARQRQTNEAGCNEVTKELLLI